MEKKNQIYFQLGSIKCPHKGGMGSSKEKYRLAKAEQRPDSKFLQAGGRTAKSLLNLLLGVLIQGDILK